MSAPNVLDDRLRILLAQLDGAWEMLDARLTGREPFEDAAANTETDLTDDEYFWEPVSGCWSIRRRSDAKASRLIGTGEWVMEEGSRAIVMSPVTTIAWRLGHLALWQLMRYDYTFGSHTMTPDEIIWPTTARDAVALLRESFTKWHSGLESMTGADLDQIGRSQMPLGLDPNVRFDDLLAWTNIEFAHHAAEVGCLRDLHRTRFGSS